MADESKVPALMAEMQALADQAAQWRGVAESDSTAMVHVGSGNPEDMRARMVEVRREARQQARALEAAAKKVRDEVEAELRRQRDLMNDQISRAMAELEPLKTKVAQMEEGIWTVNLYLGTSEEIVTLREGEPADLDEPITLRITVLNMDEEVAAFPEDPNEEGGRSWQGMDYRDLGLFDEWVAQPEHLDQMIPEKRGIVVFRPRATDYHYDDDPFVNDAQNEQNRLSYWLVRNGDNLYRMQTDFRVGDTLMPTSQEFTALFKTTRHNWETGEDEVIEILPGSSEWERAEKAQDLRRRHYMRVALILQGLIDRTDVFKPCHPINVMHQSAYDSGMVVVVNDAEKAITTGRTPYYEWLRERNAELRPGMRIIGTFRGQEWADTASYNYHGHKDGGNDRLSPKSAEKPPTNTLLTIEARREFEGQQGLVVRYERGTIYDPKMKRYVDDPRPGQWYVRGGERKPKRRASAVILPTDKSVIPFDTVTESEMREYLEARTERHAYADSFPLLQAAIAAKAEEREAEAPFRTLLLSTLANDTGLDLDAVEPYIEGLVHRFKLGNRWHRPLVSLSREDEAHALKMIRAEFKRIIASGANEDRDRHAVEALRTHDPEVMFIGRLSSGKYVAFAPMPREHGERIAHQSLWVREHTTGKTARTIATREWIAPGVRGNKMTKVYGDDRWEGWDTIATENDDLTDAEFVETTHRVRADAMRKMSTGELLAVTYDRKTRRWKVYATEPEMSWRGGVQVQYSEVQWSKRGGRIETETYRRSHETMEMSYAGNHMLDDDYVRAFDRTVYMPWRKRKHRPGFSRTPDDEARDEGLLFEAEQSVLDALILRVRQEQAKVDEDRDARKRIYAAESHIEGQARAAEVARIKAEFLAEWIDEELWEDKRERLTKDVKPGIRSMSTHDGPLYEALRELVRRGYAEGWERLTVADAYRLVEKDMPEKVQSLAGFMLAPDPSEVEAEDEGDEGWEDDDDE